MFRRPFAALDLALMCGAGTIRTCMLMLFLNGDGTGRVSFTGTGAEWRMICLFLLSIVMYV
jgi:hypothetical protein